MRKLSFIFGLVLVLAIPAYAQAREVTFTTQLNNYRGDGAYMAIYLTDSNGVYQGTLWIAGTKSKYYKHLRDWARGSGMNRSEYDGLTGASVTSGRTLKMTMDLDDSLFDSGYQVRVDTAVEDMRDNRADVVVPLTTEGAGKPVNGRGYVHSFTYDL
ncbi:DUF2271 domain-containing protein [Marinobacter sediminum]|uniref:DUF2271 domain-containing protein n=1 Tax=Marinobacter sediminum TaxID=256323 RepID=UPI00202DF2DC|nr:DUF2271 domain-containing protein [Marinobacter sediminum]MCM0612102.1 DUF2271 domain-containing protein [Marinobacter sediminum]